MANKIKLLVVEDELALAQTLEEGLVAHGFEVFTAASADSAWQAVWQHPVDVIVLDVMLPEGKEAGFVFAEQLREAKFRQPVLFLTARETLLDRVRGLEYGDDYLAKPFALAELVARLKALYRRGEVRPRCIKWQDTVLLPEEQQVRVQDVPVKLTAKEYEILELLMINPGRVFSREEILDRVWGFDYESPSNLIDVYMKNLRAKVAEEIIETVRGKGYRHLG